MKKYLILLLCMVCILPAFAKQVVKVGTNAAYQPAEYYDKDNNLVGFDIDLMSAIAKEADLDIEWVDMQFDALINSLKLGKIDAIISSMIASPVRKKQIDFTDGYTMDENDDKDSIFVVLTSSNINSFNEIKNKKIAIESGTFQHQWCEENLKDAQLIPLTYTPDLYTSLEQKKVDAIMIGGTSGLGLYMRERGIKKDKYKIIEDKKILNPSVAIGVRKGDTDLLNKLNKALAKIKKNGVYKKIQTKWQQEVKKGKEE
ncbi:MAG: transporter substrate-binding domain-containing protein [Rickettsiales bacterium]|jgi:arginine transport system substrate-binding protein|nr:transporter substrate-binding domain-containing protein [Rickettsiales bacterium]